MFKSHVVFSVSCAFNCNMSSMFSTTDKTTTNNATTPLIPASTSRVNESRTGPAGAVSAIVYDDSAPTAIQQHFASRAAGIVASQQRSTGVEVNRSESGPAGPGATVFGQPNQQQAQSVEALRDLAPPPYHVPPTSASVSAPDPSVGQADEMDFS